MAIVWPCPLPVDAYVAAGRKVEVPRPVCPSCAGPLVFWSGYWRHVRAAGRCRKIFVPRLRCGPCRVTHALLPAFVLAWRLDVAETVGAVIAEVAGGDAGCARRRRGRGCRIRPRAAGCGGSGRAPGAGGGFAALAVELGGEAIRPAAEAGRFALAAVGAAFAAAAGLAGMAPAGRVAVRVGGERREADRGQHSLALSVVGKRRFMPPVPSAPP